MSLLDERGTGAISWQRNLAVLWCGVVFCMRQLYDGSSVFTCLFTTRAAC